MEISISFSFLELVSECGGDRLEALAREGIRRIIPWAMAQHFTPRLYGSVILDMVWKVCEQCRLQGLIDEYATVRQMLRLAPEMPNARKNIEKLEQDFYLSVFHAQKHFTLETLFYHLPRLAHLASDEWMPVEWFDPIIHTDFETAGGTGIAQRNAESRLAQCQPAEWVARAAGGAPPSDFSNIYQSLFINHHPLSNLLLSLLNLSKDEKKIDLIYSLLLTTTNYCYYYRYY